MANITWPWMAGYFDSHGQAIVRFVLYKPTCSPKPYIHVQMGIHHRAKRIAKLILDFLGYGRVSISDYDIERRGLSASIKIEKKSEIYHFLVQILPFLVFKEEEIRYLLENYNFKNNTNNLNFDLEKYKEIRFKSRNDELADKL